MSCLLHIRFKALASVAKGTGKHLPNKRERERDTGGDTDNGHGTTHSCKGCGSTYLLYERMYLVVIRVESAFKAMSLEGFR